MSHDQGYGRRPHHHTTTDADDIAEAAIITLAGADFEGWAHGQAWARSAEPIVLAQAVARESPQRLLAKLQNDPAFSRFFAAAPPADQAELSYRIAYHLGARAVWKAVRP